MFRSVKVAFWAIIWMDLITLLKLVAFRLGSRLYLSFSSYHTSPIGLFNPSSRIQLPLTFVVSPSRITWFDIPFVPSFARDLIFIPPTRIKPSHIRLRPTKTQ
ncbi:hypothetical protein B0J17DRAFT_719528 [Rhizoctonia solani]|nr:hypothetical protein B0J17DRAFT_719528 [Rhizoctonia solani]